MKVREVDASDAHATVGKAIPESARLLQANGVDLPIPVIIDILVASVAEAIPVVGL
jgi:hypothetical protein